MQIKEIGLVSFSIAVFVVSFVYFGVMGGSNTFFYPTQENKMVENATRILYDFTISVLFFGFSSLAVMFVEGMNLGVTFSAKKVGVFDFLMFLPVFLSVYSAILIGRAVLRDYKGVGTIHDVLKESAAILFIAIAIGILIGSVS